MGGDTSEALNVGIYDGYDDPTGVPSPKGRPAGGDAIGTRHITQAEYDALVASASVQGDVVYVITGESEA